MLIQLIIALILGILAGTFTGLAPGIHINLISAFLVSSSITIFAEINSVFLIVFIVAMSITHTFLDYIPSVFLGCPDTDTELSILPGHELLKKGMGYEAIALTAYGGLAAIFILMIIAYPSIILIPKIYSLINDLLPYFLIAISVFLIAIENKKFNSMLAFFLTGILGFFVLNLSENLIKDPLLPLLTGLFGSSSILLSIKNKIQIPEQKITNPRFRFKPLIGSFIASPLCSFLPGLGSGQAAIIGNTVSPTDKKGFLALLGSTNTLVMGFSFVTLYAISKTRTGTAVAIKELIGEISTNIFILILIISLVSGITCFF